MKDTKTRSMIETIMDIVIGFVIYLPVNYSSFLCLLMEFRNIVL